MSGAGDFLNRNQYVAARVEATPGTEETLTATDAIKTTPPQPSPNFERIEDDSVRGSIDQAESILGGGNFGFSFQAFLKGAGAAGTAPEAGTLLRGCAMAETLLAADETGTAAAGGADTITLAAGAGANVAPGMVITLDGGTGSGQTRVVKAVSGDQATVFPAWDTQPDGTTTYTVFAAAVYTPASSALETLTMYNWQRSSAAGGQAWLRKVKAAAGTWQLTATVRQLARLDFTFTGILPAVPGQVADPGNPSFDAQQPRPILNAIAHLGSGAVRFRELGVDYGANVQQADDPAEQYGFGLARVTERGISGSINPLLEDAATRNNLSDALAATRRGIWLAWGAGAGERVSLFLPDAVLTNAEPGETDGFATEAVAFQSRTVDGGALICMY